MRKRQKKKKKKLHQIFNKKKNKYKMKNKMKKKKNNIRRNQKKYDKKKKMQEQSEVGATDFKVENYPLFQSEINSIYILMNIYHISLNYSYIEITKVIAFSILQGIW